MKYLASAIVAFMLVGFAASANTLSQINVANGNGQGNEFNKVTQNEVNCALVFGQGNGISQTNNQVNYGYNIDQESKNTAGAIGNFNTITQGNTANAPLLSTLDGTVPEHAMEQDQYNMELIVGDQNVISQTNSANIQESVSDEGVKQVQKNEAFLVGGDNNVIQSNQAEANTAEPEAGGTFEGNVPVEQCQKNLALMIGTDLGKVQLPSYVQDPITYPTLDISMPRVEIGHFPSIHVPGCRDC